MKIGINVVAILVILAGVVIALQGANIIGGSALMSGHRRWLYIGVVLAIVGVGGLYWANFRRGKTRT